MGHTKTDGHGLMIPTVHYNKCRKVSSELSDGFYQINKKLVLEQHIV
jgi:hypothetical protein